MILQHPMFPTEPSAAEAAVADDALRGFPAVFEGAAGLFLVVAAGEREGEG